MLFDLKSVHRSAVPGVGDQPIKSARRKRMRKNLRTSSAGNVPRATAVRRGALSMKMGALVSMAGAMALALALPASAQVGGPGSLVSIMTATATTQQLTLTTTVTQ